MCGMAESAATARKKYVLKIMKLIAIFSVITMALLLGVPGAAAQHCPYDGGVMIVAEVRDEAGNPVSLKPGELVLSEVGNGAPESCAFASGLVKLDFHPTAQAFSERYKKWQDVALASQCKDCAFTAPGFYAVVFGMSENSCMVKATDGRGYEKYIPRKYEIVLKRGGIEQRMAVPRSRMYSMCTGAGPWSRFQPILLATPSKAKAAAKPGGAKASPFPRERFDPKRDAKADLAAAIVEAEKSGRRIILDVGGEWCVWCVYMDRFFYENPALTKLRDDNFVWLKVNMSLENENRAFFADYPPARGYPHLYVLEKDGKLLHSQDTAMLEEGKSYDVARFIEFLKTWAPAR
jgi:thiol-disulfide isomerase/thioredoxin